MDATSGQLSKEEHNKIFRKIVTLVLDGYTPAKEGEQLTAVFLAGQPGSGKSGLNRETMKEFSPDRTVTIDVDALREHHPEYKNWRADPKMEKIAASLSHEDASAWGKQLLRTAINNKANIIVDGTFGSAESAQKHLGVVSENGI